MIKNPLAFKSVMWDAENHKFASPFSPDYKWGNNGEIKVANCIVHPDNPNHIPPVESCSCGLYCAYDWLIAAEYDYGSTNVMLLVEAGGTTVLHELGYRSKEMRIVASVFLPEDTVNYKKLFAYQAKDYFGIALLSLEAALTVMNYVNVTNISHYEPFGVKHNRQYYFDLGGKLFL